MEINEEIIKKVNNNGHTMSSMPYIKDDKNLITERFNYLSENYSNTFNTNFNSVKPFDVVYNASNNAMDIIKKEKNHKLPLLDLAEKIVRDEYNLGYDEVLFDLEILEPGEITLPDSINKTKKISKNFKQSDDKDILKKRTINALSQGAAKKSHYIFHMYGDEIEKITPNIITPYQKAILANDLIYYIMSDEDFENYLESGSDSNNAGYVRINYDGDIPIIEAKSICMPLLIHEMIKGVISLLSVPGIQNMSQDIIDETDFIMSEIWEIRYGPTLWTEFHDIIDTGDYDIKKLIILEIFKMESDEFLRYMNHVMNNKPMAISIVSSIVKKIRRDIVNHGFNE